MQRPIYSFQPDAITFMDKPAFYVCPMADKDIHPLYSRWR